MRFVSKVKCNRILNQLYKCYLVRDFLVREWESALFIQWSDVFELLVIRNLDLCLFCNHVQNRWLSTSNKRVRSKILNWILHEASFIPFLY